MDNIRESLVDWEIAGYYIYKIGDWKILIDIRDYSVRVKHRRVYQVKIDSNPEDIPQLVKLVKKHGEKFIEHMFFLSETNNLNYINNNY